MALRAEFRDTVIVFTLRVVLVLDRLVGRCLKAPKGCLYVLGVRRANLAATLYGREFCVDR